VNATRFTPTSDSAVITLDGSDPLGGLHSRLVARLQLALRTSEQQMATEIAPDAYRKATWLLLGDLLTVRNALAQLRDDARDPLSNALLAEARPALHAIYAWATDLIEAVERGLRRAPLPELDLPAFLDAMDHCEEQAIRFNLGRIGGHIEVLICAVLLLHRDAAAAVEG
jgi:hypothetical protein